MAETKDCRDAITSSQGDKQEVMEEQCCVKKEREKEKNTKLQSKKPSQPAIFVPVDRSPEIQVCMGMVPLSLRLNSNTKYPVISAQFVQLLRCRRPD